MTVINPTTNMKEMERMRTMCTLVIILVKSGLRLKDEEQICKEKSVSILNVCVGAATSY
jgi:tartrate dehydratase beta subunit/fumarate hydratase class I family protein